MLGSLDSDATIAAIASPPGPATRGIVRLSGDRAWSIAKDGFEPEPKPGGIEPVRARAQRGLLRLQGLHSPLPATISFWRGPRSYTGQDVAEIHTTGSPPLLGLVLASCLERGARAAQPGEFTLRAFLSGRLDLTRAEAVLAVIDARNRHQLDAALDQLAGGLCRSILALRDRLLDHTAHLEANLDFVDEADVDPIGQKALLAELEAATGEIEAMISRLSGRDRASGHARVVLTGPPNAGKSRLFNALAGGDAAIVSPRAGTTRDYLTALTECGGMTVELIDTAGIETPGGPIQAQAQSLRDSETRRADLVLRCWPADSTSVVDVQATSDLPTLHIRTKCDLWPPDLDVSSTVIATSAATGQGLTELRNAIAAAILSRSAEEYIPASTSARCRGSLECACQALRAAALNVTRRAGDELVAFELRTAIDELGKIVGEVVTEDILDRIFQRFCIGK